MEAKTFTTKDKVFAALIALLVIAAIVGFVFIAKLSGTTVVLDESLTKAKEQVVQDCSAKIQTIAKLQDELEANEVVNNGNLLDKINENSNLDSRTKAALKKLIDENSDGDKVNKEELSLKLASEDLALKDALTILITDNTENIDELRDRVADDEELAAATKTELLDLIDANAEDIAQNASDISQNAGDISQNATDISTNAEDISDNAAEIVALKNRLDAAEGEILALSTTTYKDGSNATVNVTDKDKVAFLRAYPVGSVYLTINSAENTVAKMTELHGGTWTVFSAGKSLVGVDTANAAFNSPEKTGGNALALLNASNIPSLTSSGWTTAANGVGSTNSAGSHSHTYTSPVNHTKVTNDMNGSYVPVFLGVDANNNDGAYDDVRLYGGGDAYDTVGDVDWLAYNGTNYGTNTTGDHAHNLNIPALGLSATYTNNSVQSFSIQDPYTSVYMYKRVG